MHDFGKLVYLDVPKTGSTYVNRFLSECCTEDERAFRKHDWIRNEYSKDSFYFITIRHPLEWYKSLYRFEEGYPFLQIMNAGRFDVYKSFETFLEFVLDQRNANILGYNPCVGLASYMYLRLSLQFPIVQIEKCLREGRDILSLTDKFITDLVIKNEEMESELYRLVETFPSCFDQKAGEFLEKRIRINESPKPKQDYSVSKELIDKLNVKEELLLRRYRDD